VDQAVVSVQSSAGSAGSRNQRDEALISAAQAGSASAFVELYNLYSRLLFRVCLRITRNKEDAEDALQDCFLQAFKSLEKFQRRASFGTWIGRIAINSSLMLLRRRKRRQETSLYQFLSDSGDWAPVVEVRDDRPDPERQFVHREKLSNLEEAMRRLTPNLREALELRMATECTVREAAGAFNISETAMKARLFRARMYLS
jgi:RNA polymerase sigma-70 factor, ECF subfamily